MKNFIALLLFFFTLKIGAQDPRLFSNSWYLDKLVIDNDIYFLPQNSEMGTVINLFTANNTFETGICSAALNGSGLTITNEIIDAFDIPIFFPNEECFINDNIIFSGFYINFFYDPAPEEYIFQYTIIEENESLILVLTNELGDQAFYNNTLLSNNSFKEKLICINPNPVKNTLTITTTLPITQATLFSVSGQHIKTWGNQTQLNLGDLQTGIYFITITTPEGKVTKKVIKQ